MVLMTLLLCASLYAQSPPAMPCKFLSDSGGSTADSGAVVSISFIGGQVSFSGSGSVQVQESGSYSVSGNQMTISLPGLGKSGHGQWGLQLNTLRLPFQVFSDAPGFSLWNCPPEGGSSSQSHPPNPPDPPGPGSGSGSGQGVTPKGGTSSSPGDNSSSTNTDPGDGSGSSSAKRPSNNWQDSPFAPYVGDWVGIGWAWEVRFKSGDWNGHPDEKNSVMTLTVRHLARFDFTVDAKGQVVGNGEVTYDLDPNLCGVYRAAEQINMAIDVLKNLNSALNKARAFSSMVNEIFGTKSQMEAAEAKDKIESWKKFKNADSDTQFGVKQTHTSPWRNMGHNAEDTGDLAASVGYERCRTGAPVGIVGGLTCADMIAGPPLTAPGEVESTGTKLTNTLKEQGADFAKDVVKDAWKKLQEKDPNFWNHDANYLYTEVAGEAVDAAADALKEKAIKSINLFDVQEKPGKDECAGIPSTQTAGNSFNTPTAATVMERWNELADAANSMNPDAAVNVLMNAPGVTKVQYDYKGLENGPESRRFKIRGHIDGNKLVLRKDGDVYGGDINLNVQYTVNMVTTKGKFPTWSPFIDDDGADLSKSGKIKQLERKTVTCPVKDAKPASGKTATGPPAPPCTPHEELVTTYSDSASPFAIYYKKGEHRNNVQAWHDYEYYWNAYKVTEPLSITQQ